MPLRRSKITKSGGDKGDRRSDGPPEPLTARRMSVEKTWARMSLQSHDDDDDDNDGGDENDVEHAAAAASAAAPASEIVYKIDSRLPTLDAILLESRLDALLACDNKVVSYDPTSFWIVFRLRGRNIRMIVMPLLALSLWGIMWILILGMDGMESVRETIVSLHDMISPLLVPVSFLLVFRLGRAAVRFWDARTALGKLVETSRVLISTAAVGCADRQTLVEDMARWLCVLPIAVTNFLRPATRKGWQETSRIKKQRVEIGPLISDEDADEILGTAEKDGSGRRADENFGPILVLNRLRELAFKVSVYEETDGRDMNKGGGAHFDSPMRGAMLYRQLNEQIDTLTGAWGAMERINATPLPLVYVVHLRTFLMLYLVLWHMEAAAAHSWVAIPTLFAASWGLLGIEAAAVECERPFRWHTNHLALGKMCVVVSRNVAQTLRNVEDKHYDRLFPTSCR